MRFAPHPQERLVGQVQTAVRAPSHGRVPRLYGLVFALVFSVGCWFGLAVAMRALIG